MYISLKQKLDFSSEKREIFFNFIFSRRRRLRFQLLFILKDEHELENIFHIESRSMNIRLCSQQILLSIFHK
jgi:hypothetical protein